MSPSPSYSSVFPKEEWDFSGLSEMEVEACFLWECAREWQDLDVSAVKWQERYAKNSLVGDEADSQINVKNSAFVFHLFWKIFGGQPKPWQSLSPIERRLIQFEPKPVLSPITSRNAREFLQQLDHGATSQTDKHVAFLIDWYRSDHQLMAAFAEWLKTNRRHEAREVRGSTTRDRLKMIGAMRLLHQYPFEQAFDLTVQMSNAPLYGKRPSWERARKGALEAYRNGFFYNWERCPSAPTPKSYPKYRQRSTVSCL